MEIHSYNCVWCQNLYLLGFYRLTESGNDYLNDGEPHELVTAWSKKLEGIEK